MTSTTTQDNAELRLREQNYGDDPLADRDTDLYRGEYVMSFVEKWDELIDWDARAQSEGRFFIDVLRARDKKSVVDVATGTGFHSVRLTEAGFDVTSADGSAAMLAKAFENGKKRGLILKSVQADWRQLNKSIQGKYDAIICLGKTAGQWVRERLGAHDETDSYQETNARGWRSASHRSSAGVVVCTLTHPGRVDWTNPDADPSPMVLRALGRE